MVEMFSELVGMGQNDHNPRKSLHVDGHDSGRFWDEEKSGYLAGDCDKTAPASITVLQTLQLDDAEI